jgi:hypothetical protein
VTDPIAEALDKFVPAFPSAEGDWQAILSAAAAPAGLVPSGKIPAGRSLRRSGFWRRVPARVALLAAVVALAAVVTAVAFGWPHRVVDFFSAPPAPAKVKNFVGFVAAVHSPGMSPRAIPGQTRKITTVRFNAPDCAIRAGARATRCTPGDVGPRLHTLYVAPTKSGGFCEVWTGFIGGCFSEKTPPHPSGPLEIGVGPHLIYGIVRSGATRTVEARFADGSTATILPTWIGAPINAGFVAYPLPRGRVHALRSVVALDADGRVIGKLSFRPRSKQPPSHPHPWISHTLPDGTGGVFPPDAEVAKARKIISFRATNGSKIYLWLIPLTGGGHCFISDGAHGLDWSSTLCNLGQGLTPREETSPYLGPSPPYPKPVFVGGYSGGASSVMFFGVAKPAVATVELRYQNGDRERLTPIDGYILHELAPAHWTPGTRLVAAVALNRNGKAISTERFLNPQEPGVYPCSMPINHICP